MARSISMTCLSWPRITVIAPSRRGGHHRALRFRSRRSLVGCSHWLSSGLDGVVTVAVHCVPVRGRREFREANVAQQPSQWSKKGDFKFSAGPWNLHGGADPFGPPVRAERSFAEKLKTFKDLGFEYVQFHDDDAVPDEASAPEREKKAKEV